MPDMEVLEARIGAIHSDVAEMRGSMTKMADALERLARLEERHQTVSESLKRAFTAIGRIEARMTAIEIAQPIQRLTSGWVMNGAWAAAGMIAMAVIKKVGLL